jgi:hypothetical protein
MFPLTKTDIAKMAVSYTVALWATRSAEDTMKAFTSMNTETITVKVGTTVAGHLLAWQVRPLTDKAVDITVNRLKSLKPNFKTK